MKITIKRIEETNDTSTIKNNKEYTNSNENYKEKDGELGEIDEKSTQKVEKDAEKGTKLGESSDKVSGDNAKLDLNNQKLDGNNQKDRVNNQKLEDNQQIESKNNKKLEGNSNKLECNNGSESAHLAKSNSKVENRAHTAVGGAKCGAHSRSTGKPCKNPAGFGTDHVGTGRCKYHGGKSTGPKDKSKFIGNDHAVKTGEFQKIFSHTLTDDEKKVAEEVNHDKVELLKTEIVLTTIRERRMMERISLLQQDIHDLQVVSKQYMEGEGSRSGGEGEGGMGGGMWSQTHKQYQHKLERIQSIEEALTRVQQQKSKQLELLHKLEVGNSTDTGAIDKLVEKFLRESQLPDEDDDDTIAFNTDTLQ